MKKQRKKPQPKRNTAQGNPDTSAQKAKAQSRRRFLSLARNAAIALPVLGGIGFISIRSAQAKLSEADLSKIKLGKPSIVQIHDPNCALCVTLQAQTRRVLKDFDKDAVTFLVADISTRDGRLFAARYNVPHVTLLLFDAKGEMVQVVRGPSDIDSLRSIVGAHLDAYG